jgi:Rps23 Pro-64 3,4-dihydroxylase Tpa1-like proline 4-hydroxylase
MNPSSKRSKTSVLLTDVLSKDILDQKLQFTEQYNNARPYPHCILKTVFQEGFFELLVKEIKDNSKVNFKESDLFKFYQSIDLANLNNITDSMPTVMQLRQVLYSDEWRSFIEAIAGLEPGTLNQQVDCACNCHVSGCHLLCHDDVIGTRKISYILYLTDEDWKQEEGGALELYEADSERLPTAVPAACALPIRNSMAFFAVEPGVSFHAVQEVLGDRPRLSLQGWYHTKEPPANIQDATLQRLKHANQLNGVRVVDTSYYQSWKGTVEAMDSTKNDNSDGKNGSSLYKLSEGDQAYLSQYIDKTYLQPQALEEMGKLFEAESSIQLRSFLNESLTQQIDLQEARIGVTDKEFYKQGVTDSWKLVGPSHMQRFLELSTGKGHHSALSPDDDALNNVLFRIRNDLLQSQPFARFLALVTGLNLIGYKGQIRRFRRGLDYTVAHCGLLTDSAVLDATLCFVAGSGKQQVLEETSDDSNDDDDEEEKPTQLPDLNEADLAWQSGDVGGFECYIEADNDDDAADEYNQEDESELLSVSAGFNTLSIVFRDPGTIRFVKYISAKAPSSRWDIAMEYQVEKVDEGDDEEDKEELAEVETDDTDN